MHKTILHMAIETVPGYDDHISLFTKKPRLAQYADSTIYNYRLKISQAVLYLGKIYLQLHFFELVVDVVDYNLTGTGLYRECFYKFLQLSIRNV